MTNMDYNNVTEQDLQVLDLMLRGRALEICRSAVEWFGRDNQISQATEEMGELIAALNHIKRGKCTKDDVCSEIADVLIMCNQLAEIYGRQDVQMHIDDKLKRLRKQCYEKNLLLTDNELIEEIIRIPKGYVAIIEGQKVYIKKK